MSRWSYSRITTYEKCPRAYKYKYIDREKEAFESIEAFMGSRVHETIEWLYGDHAGQWPTPEQAVQKYTERWAECWLKPERPIKVVRDGDTVEQYLGLGAEVVRSFYARYLVDPFTTLAIEHEVTMVVGDYTFMGYIDRCARDPQQRPWIIDYKTGKHAPEEFIGNEADQVRAYGLAILKAKPELEKVYLRLDFVRAGKVIDGEICRSDMARIERQLVSRIQAAEVKSWSTRVGPLCGWCGYNLVCDGPKKAKEKKTALPF